MTEKLSKEELYALLDRALEASPDVYTHHVQDPEAYVANGKKHLLASRVEPVWVTASVEEMGRQCGIEGDTVSGYLLAASRGGSWLIYVPDEDIFHVAWGFDVDHLGVHGFYGKDPLAIWLD